MMKINDTGLNYWHPVISDTRLPSKVLIQILGREIILVNCRQGLFAIDRACPHRSMDMMEGMVIEDGILCPFHNWKLCKSGRTLDSLGNEILFEQSQYQIEKYLGFVWLREKRSATDLQVLPKIGFIDQQHIYSKLYRANSSFELVVDIFNEAEHTANTHHFLGYAANKKKDLLVEIIVKDRLVHSINRGMQKDIPFPFSALMPFHKGDLFKDDFYTNFEPVNTRYEHQWYDPINGTIRNFKLTHYMYFVPKNHYETNVVLFTFMFHKFLKYPGLRGVIVWVMNKFTDFEMRLDMKTIKKIINDGSSKHLQQFDRALPLIRERIEKIYLGNEQRNNPCDD
jgi:phenylpropionate dioxygenase-like ring-hydroxylating dioxygenase large terminal subunit